MNSKTKRKIESIAQGNKDLYGIDFSAGMHKGAIPWAEWCESFVKDLESLRQLYLPVERPKPSAPPYAIESFIVKRLSEYDKWLEDVDG